MAKKKSLDTLDLDKVIIDDDFQGRADGINDEHVEQMVEALKKKPGCLPRVEITHVKAIGYVLTDGFGRYEAHKRAKLKTIQCVINPGSMLDATIAASTANIDQVARHRSNADKRRQVELLLRRLLDANEEWSDRRVADTVGVSNHLVATIRSEVGGNSPTQDSEKNEDIPLDDPPKRTASEKKPEARKGQKAEADSWETIALDEFLQADPFVWDALKALRIVTAGDLLSRILAGEKFGLTQIDVMDLKSQVEKVKAGNASAETPREPRRKASGEEKGFDWREFESAFRIIAQAPDELASLTNPSSPRRAACIAHLTAFHREWSAWEAEVKAKEQR